MKPIGQKNITNELLTGQDTTLDILLAGEKQFISNIPCRIVNSTIRNINIELSVLTTSRLRVLFDDIDEDMRAQLDTILKRYVAGSA